MQGRSDVRSRALTAGGAVLLLLLLAPLPALAQGCDALGGDSDGDGICDDGSGSGRVGDLLCAHQQTSGCDDNCPTLFNPDQANSDALPPGDACQCGDVDGDHDVDIGDVALATRHGAGRTNPRFFNPTHCSVAGTALDCAADDVAGMRGFLARPLGSLPQLCIGRCGDGLLQSGEQCDGSALAGRSCASFGFTSGVLACDEECRIDLADCGRGDPACGNGVLDPGESCEGADLASNDCTTIGLGFTGGVLACLGNCTFDASGCAPAPVCGNASLEWNEACDDSNTADGDGCSASCGLEAVCGNTLLEPGEVCDDGNRIDGDGCDASCASETFCGNGIVETGEACDDGNRIDGDGCGGTCRLEAVCGNGQLEPGEQCDDGNLLRGDGCSPSCGNEICSDVLESNDSAEKATPVDSEGETFVGLNLGSNDEDWFVVELCTAFGAPYAAEITATATFLHADGDLDLFIHASNQPGLPVLAQSVSSDDGESVHYADDWILGSAQGVVYVRAVHKTPAVCTPYDLEISVGCFCHDDIFERNDNFNQSVLLPRPLKSIPIPPPRQPPEPYDGEVAVLQTASPAWRDDWFHWRVCPFQELDVLATFDRFPDNRVFGGPEADKPVVATLHPEWGPPISMDPLSRVEGGRFITDYLGSVLETPFLPWEGLWHEGLRSQDLDVQLTPGGGICRVYDIEIRHRHIEDDFVDRSGANDGDTALTAFPLEDVVLPGCVPGDLAGDQAVSLNAGLLPGDPDWLYSIDGDDDWYRFAIDPNCTVKIWADEERGSSTLDGDVDVRLFNSGALESAVTGPAKLDRTSGPVFEVSDATADYTLQVEQAGFAGCIKYDLRACETCGLPAWDPSYQEQLVPVFFIGGLAVPQCSVFIAGPDLCPGDHVHGTVYGFNLETGIISSIEDPNPPGCGHGEVSALEQAALLIDSDRACAWFDLMFFLCWEF